MESALSQLAVYSARPTLRIDTEEIPIVSELLIGFEMVEKEGGLSTAELRFSNVASESGGGAAFAFDDDRFLQLGSSLAIYGGDELAPQEIFQGVITGFEAEFPELGPPELVVQAEDIFQRARMLRRTKFHQDLTIQDLANQIAGELSITAVASQFTDNIGHQMQLNESDLAFLRRLLARYDGDLQIVGQEMHVSPRSEVSRGSVTLQLHNQLRSATFTADLAHQVSDVSIIGWDPMKGERVNKNSTGQNLGSGRGSTGAEILSDKFGERPHLISHLAAITNEEAEAMAQAAFDKRARQFVCVEGTAEGNPAIRVGTNLTLSGVGQRFENDYYVTEACHRWDVNLGYETDFCAECAYLGHK